MMVIMLVVRTKLTLLKNLTSSNNSINSKDRSLNTCGQASKNIN